MTVKPWSDVGKQQGGTYFRRKGDVVSLGQVEFEVIRCCSSGDAQQTGKIWSPKRNLN